MWNKSAFHISSLTYPYRFPNLNAIFLNYVPTIILKLLTEKLFQLIKIKEVQLYQIKCKMLAVLFRNYQCAYSNNFKTITIITNESTRQLHMHRCCSISCFRLEKHFSYSHVATFPDFQLI